MKVYNENEQPYLGKDVSDVGQGAGLLQMTDRVQFQKGEAYDNSALQPKATTSKALTSAKHTAETLKEVLGILHGFEKFHHSCQ